LTELLLEKETVDGSAVYALVGRSRPDDHGVVEAPATVATG
jgi:hypothetical protein